MPATISNKRCSFSESGSVNYVGTEEEAKSDLENLKKQLVSGTGVKSGYLRLVQTEEGGVELRRRQWYQFWLGGKEEDEKVASFVETLLQKAYPTTRDSITKLQSSSVTEEQRRGKALGFLRGRVGANLTSYLTARGKRVGTQGLLRILTQHTGVDIEEIKQIDLFSEIFGFSEDSEEDVERDKIKMFLSEIGVTVGSLMGRGSWGQVYTASLGDEEKEVSRKEAEYVVKFEEKPQKMSPHELTSRGDLAASEAKLLKHMTKPIFVVLKVCSDNGKPQYYYVPADQADTFVQKVTNTKKDTTVSLVAQLMARAPGEDLQKVVDLPISSSEGLPRFETLKDAKKKLGSPDTFLFQQFAKGCVAYFEHAWRDDFIHRDIKPSNIKIDPATGEVTFFDAGFASKGPIPFSGERVGTLAYMHPYLYEAREDGIEKNTDGTLKIKTNPASYSTEIDAFSIGMTLLEVLDPEGVNKYNQAMHKNKRELELRRAAGKKPRPQHPLMTTEEFQKNPEQFLTRYLDQYGTKAKETLEAHPALKELLYQYFVISAGGGTTPGAREAAFGQWKAAAEVYEESTQAGSVARAA